MLTTDRLAQKVILVDELTLTEAESFISGCQHCAWTSEITFDHLLDAVTGSNPIETEYVICGAPRCPSCKHEVTEDTFVLAV
jgi:hypothetical protein